MTLVRVVRADGSRYLAEAVPNPKRRHVHSKRCGPKCRRRRYYSRVRREVRHHAKEAARETVSGAAAALVAITILVAVGIGAKSAFG